MSLITFQSYTMMCYTYQGSNMKPYYFIFRICIEEDIVTDYVVTYKNLSHLNNCLSVHTRWDFYSSFGWLVVFVCCASGVLVIYTGRQNIEILYFGAKPYVDKAQHDNLTLILENLNAYNEESQSGGSYRSSRCTIRTPSSVSHASSCNGSARLY